MVIFLLTQLQVMTPSFIEVQGIRLALYERPGDKPVLFFIHGNSSNAHAFEAVWNHANLQRYHLVAIDLPGHGKSESPADVTSYTFSSLRTLLAHVIDELRLEGIILVGHSMGGHIALSVLNSTDKIIGVSLAGSVPIHGAHEVPNAYILSDAAQTVFRAEATESEILQFSKNAVHKKEKHAILLQSFKETDKNFRKEMGLELGRHFGSDNFISEIEVLKKRNMPVCLVHGAEENVVNLSHLRSIKGLNLFKKRVHVVADAGHGVPFESPDEYALILADFATELSTAPASDNSAQYA